MLANNKVKLLQVYERYWKSWRVLDAEGYYWSKGVNHLIQRFGLQCWRVTVGGGGGVGIAGQHALTPFFSLE